MAVKRPKFLSKNSVNATYPFQDLTGIVDGSGVALVDGSGVRVTDNVSISSTTNLKRLYDRNENRKWYSSETSGETILNLVAASAIATTRIIIQNCNWKTFTITYNDETAFSTPIAVTGSTHKNYYFEFTSVSISELSIIITDTHTASDNREVGQIYLGTELMEWASTYTDDIKIGGDGKIIMNKLSDGTYFKSYIRDALQFNVKLQAVPVAEKTNFRTIYETNRINTIVFVPNPRTQTDEFDGIAPHVNWGNNWDIVDYHRGLEANGYDGAIKLYQAGGNT